MPQQEENKPLTIFMEIFGEENWNNKDKYKLLCRYFGKIKYMRYLVLTNAQIVKYS